MTLWLFKNKRRDNLTTVTRYKREMLIKLGREQFKKLMEKGLRIPVALL